jgi:hypothetical protein
MGGSTLLTPPAAAPERQAYGIGQTPWTTRQERGRRQPVMWLNVIILSIASLSVGFILGWVVGRPRRWEYVGGETVMRPDDLTRLPGLSGGASPGARSL